MKDPIEAELERMLQHHVSKFGTTPDVNPPDSEGPAPTEADPQVMPEMTITPRTKAPPAAPPRMPIDLSKPLGYSAPKDTQLAGLQADAKQRRGEAVLGQTVTDYAERPTNFLDYAQRLGGGGVTAAPKSQMWKNHAAEGEQDIADLQERRKSDAGMAGAAEDRDPNSPTAQAYRSVLVKFAPDIAKQLEGANAKQMRAMAPWLEKFHAENSDTLRANAAAEAKAVQQAKTDKERGEKLALEKEHYEQAQKNSDRTFEASMANAAATRALAGGRVETEKENKDQAGAQHLGDKAGEGQSAAAALDAIDAEIAKNPNDIPGVGKWKSKLPDFIANSVLSDEGVGVRNNARDVLGILLHKRSGAAVSPAELSRYEGMYGLNGSDEQFKAGIARMRRDYASELAATQAGVSPGAKQKFKEAGGMLAEDIAKPSAPAKVVDHYLVSPDKKRRVPVYADGTEGPEEVQ